MQVSKTVAQRTQNALVYSIHVSHGSVATWCSGIFNDSFIANFPQCVSKKIFFLNPLKIDKVIELDLCASFFLEHGVYNQIARQNAEKRTYSCSI